VSKLRDTNFGTHKFDLAAKDREFFVSTAAEQNFDNNSRYLSFIQALFPCFSSPDIQPSSAQDEIEYVFGYSEIDFDHIREFIELMLHGVESSQKVKNEKAQGRKITRSITIFIRPGRDGFCNIVVDDDVLLDALNDPKWRLEDVSSQIN